MIHFHKYTWLYILISTIVIGSGLFSFVKWGFRYSIDFTGGTTLVYSFAKMPKQNELSNILKKNKITIEKINTSGNTFEVQTNPLNEKQEEQLRKTIGTTLGTQVKTLRFETVGPTMGKETTQKTGTAFILAICGILLYMSFAFKDVKFAFSAVLAMMHDFFVLVGSYSLLSHFFGASFDLMFVTAMLTTMSFSVHDTIVIFDKIREYVKSGAKGASIEDLSDKAVSETMVRSLNNSLTIVFMLVALLLLGGGTIRFFAAALLIGTITGSYSSPFVATPILIWLMNKNKTK